MSTVGRPCDNDERKRTPSSDDGDYKRIEREAIQREGNF
jgi:hypothetical protein